MSRQLLATVRICSVVMAKSRMKEGAKMGRTFDVVFDEELVACGVRWNFGEMPKTRDNLENEVRNHCYRILNITAEKEPATVLSYGLHPVGDIDLSRPGERFRVELEQKSFSIKEV